VVNQDVLKRFPTLRAMRSTRKCFMKRRCKAPPVMPTLWLSRTTRCLERQATVSRSTPGWCATSMKMQERTPRTFSTNLGSLHCSRLLHSSAHPTHQPRPNPAARIHCLRVFCHQSMKTTRGRSEGLLSRLLFSLIVCLSTHKPTKNNIRPTLTWGQVPRLGSRIARLRWLLKAKPPSTFYPESGMCISRVASSRGFLRGSLLTVPRVSVPIFERSSVDPKTHESYCK
jgi:hypothetical protein